MCAGGAAKVSKIGLREGAGCLARLKGLFVSHGRAVRGPFTGRSSDRPSKKEIVERSRLVRVSVRKRSMWWQCSVVVHANPQADRPPRSQHAIKYGGMGCLKRWVGRYGLAPSLAVPQQCSLNGECIGLANLV